MLLEQGRAFHLHRGDCIEVMAQMPAASVDFCVHSPPFPSLFSYTSEACDLGNAEDFAGEVRLHFNYFFQGVRRLIKPGRVMVVHCTQIARMKRSGGGGGLFDFRGLLIRCGERAGFVYDYDYLVRRNPQAQAIRTKSRSLQFAGLESDRSQSRGALGDYLIKFRMPGENAVPVDSKGEVSRNQWIEWAECCWRDIKETDTLNVRTARGADDTRHICPLQLGVIERLVRLYSNPGEVVFSPFAGIGSEGYVALKLGRRFVGCELKPEYHAAALRNLETALQEHQAEQRTLFDKQDGMFAGGEQPEPDPDEVA